MKTLSFHCRLFILAFYISKCSVLQVIKTSIVHSKDKENSEKSLGKISTNKKKAQTITEIFSLHHPSCLRTESFTSFHSAVNFYAIRLCHGKEQLEKIDVRDRPLSSLISLRRLHEFFMSLTLRPPLHFKEAAF